jgi:hypothetical protein
MSQDAVKLFIQVARKVVTHRRRRRDRTVSRPTGDVKRKYASTLNKK